ncbi:TRAP transporter small permease subunit [Desulfobacula sp.]|uniref:TRAP transporter small permease subunit n=1 Tax=Desulfobacula sp. TaxID=2593537 RepID=UPI0026308B22|nr:TRAP transporter small permease subunit [Desulfobacula sp.]
MIKGIQSFFSFIHWISEKLGDGVSILIMAIMFFTAIEVILRYVFNSPTIWVWPVSRQIFGVYILCAGIYAMSSNAHIRIEIFYNLFSKRLKQIASVFALLSFVLFMGVLIWQGTWMGQNSLASGETAHGAFRIPLYPLKIFIPVAAILFFLEGIYVLSKNKD